MKLTFNGLYLCKLSIILLFWAKQEINLSNTPDSRQDLIGIYFDVIPLATPFILIFLFPS